MAAYLFFVLCMAVIIAIALAAQDNYLPGDEEDYTDNDNNN